MCAICREQTTDTGARREPWKCETTATWVYKQLPDSVRPATQNDLFKNGQPNYGLLVLIQSMHNSLYHVAIINKNFSENEINCFINNKKIYVKTN